jgi:hypothetical protein
VRIIITNLVGVLIAVKLWQHCYLPYVTCLHFLSPLPPTSVWRLCEVDCVLLLWILLWRIFQSSSLFFLAQSIFWHKYSLRGTCYGPVKITAGINLKVLQLSPKHVFQKLSREHLLKRNKSCAPFFSDKIIKLSNEDCFFQYTLSVCVPGQGFATFL